MANCNAVHGHGTETGQYRYAYQCLSSALMPVSTEFAVNTVSGGNASWSEYNPSPRHNLVTCSYPSTYTGTEQL
jgi:hypothetical protein